MDAVKRERERRLSEGRWAKKIARKRLKQEYRRSLLPESERQDSVYISNLMDRLSSIAHKPFKKRRSEPPKSFKLPAKFSLSSNPEGVMRVVTAIAKFSRSCRKPRIVVDHRDIKEIGLGAEGLLALVLKEFSRECSSVHGSYIKGYKPSDKKIRKVLDEIGSVRVLGTGVDEDIRVSLKSDATVFRHYNYGRGVIVDPFISDHISTTTMNFSEHLDRCLSIVNKKLSPKGRADLLAHVAEVLINADEHSQTREWVIIGYIDSDDADLMYRLVIFSVGKTISQTFTDLPADSVPRLLVDPYVARHEDGGIFSSGWNQDSLMTVISLQGQVSSKNNEENEDRGQGTVDLIEFFQGVSDECSGAVGKSMLAIVSGNTLIKFSDKYKMVYEEGFGRKVIAFNSANDLNRRPDSSCVVEFGGAPFPGVMISIAVPLAVGFVEGSAYEN